MTSQTQLDSWQPTPIQALGFAIILAAVFAFLPALPLLLLPETARYPRIPDSSLLPALSAHRLLIQAIAGFAVGILAMLRLRLPEGQFRRWARHFVFWAGWAILVQTQPLAYPTLRVWLRNQALAVLVLSTLSYAVWRFASWVTSDRAGEDNSSQSVAP